ncbi:RICIN domain-containing protein [Kitasatospora sp. NPDC059463]|uniref:RICIN domain-containing protein n=1 Tax=unclassified Kitasatospora TaxID=2633591 RepID=UPI00368B9C76
MSLSRATRFLATAGVAALLPLAFASQAQAAVYIGNFALYNVSTGKCADLPGYGWNQPDSPVNQYGCALGTGDNQMWDVIETRLVNGLHLFKFVNSKSQYCLDLPGYGAAPTSSRLSVYTCAPDPETDNQEWYLVPVTGDGGNEIVNYKNGLCLDVWGLAADGSDRADDLPLTVYPCYNSSWGGGGYDDHIWRFVN